MVVLFTFHYGFAQTTIRIVPHSLCTQLIIERKDEKPKSIPRG